MIAQPPFWDRAGSYTALKTRTTPGRGGPRAGVALALLPPVAAGGRVVCTRVAPRTHPHTSHFSAQVHPEEELHVVLGLLHLAEHPLHRLDGVHVGQHLAEHADALVLVRVHEEFFLARAAGGHV